MISNSGRDSRGKYRGDKAGDQDGKEWAVIPWYNRPWTCVLRHPDQRIAKDIAYCARAAAENDKIGYDQEQRATFWKALCNTPNYDPAKINMPCESDCTCGAATCVKAAGLRKGNVQLGNLDPDYFYSGNMRQGFKNIGFQVLTDPKYLTSDRYLLPGDILLYDNHHAATNLDVGSMVRDEWRADQVKYQLGWNRDDIGWWYADTDHSYMQRSWKKINGCWYYFNKEGYAVKGHQKIDGKDWYFCAEPGHPKECALMITDPEGALHVWGAA